MIYPKNLEKGYKIGVTATSDGFVKEVDIRRLENGIRHFSEIGYPVIETREEAQTDPRGRRS